MTEKPVVGVISPVGSHSHGDETKTIEEATRDQLERNRLQRLDPDSYLSREDARVREAIEKERARKARRRAHPPR